MKFKKEYKLFLFLFISILLVSLISAPFGYNNPNLPSLIQELFGDKPPSFYMPNNKSVVGNFDFNGGWMNNGLSIIDGDIYAQTGFFLNLTSLNVTRQNLTIISDLILDGFTQGSTLFIGSNGQILEDNSNLFWDNTNNRLGIGTDNPQAHLTVRGISPTIRIHNDGLGFGINIIQNPDASGDIIMGSAGLLTIGTDNNNVNTGLAFSTGANVEKMRIDFDGNVGIGTDSPNTKLHIKGNDGITLGDGNDADQTLLTVNVTGTPKLIWDESRDSFDISNKLGINAVGTSTNPALFFGGDTDSGLWRPTSNVLAFSTGGEERLRINNAGRVGIATATPNDNLHVKTGTDGKGITIQRDSTTADTFANLNFLMTTTDSATPNTYIRAFRRTGFDDVDMEFVVGGNSILYLDDNGRVGIGTDSPAVKLDVNGSIRIANNKQLQFRNNADTGNAKIQMTTANNLQIVGDTGSMQISAGSDITFYTGGGAFNELMRIKASGKVGIGTSTPDFKLQVNGSIAPEETGVSSFGTLALRWLKGWFNGIDILGNLNQTNGNATINMIYGEMGNSSDATFNVDLITLNVYENITNLTDGSQNGFTLSNSKLTSSMGGLYRVFYSISFSGNANSEIGFSLGIGGASEMNTHSHRTIGTGGDVGSVSGTGLVRIEIGDIITLMARDEQTPIADITIAQANINLLRIGN